MRVFTLNLLLMLLSVSLWGCDSSELLVPKAASAATAPSTQSAAPLFNVLAFYNFHVEPDHVSFATYAMVYFDRLSRKNNFKFEATDDWSQLNTENLKRYQLVMWLNDSPGDPKQRAAFEQYMEHGGAWLGFHVAGYNDKFTKWPWFVQFMGGGVFNMNNWPPLPAKLTVDVRDHPVTHDLPESFIAPLNEWYQWLPSPRLNKDVKVLVTLDPSNYPLGKKDFLTGGDTPVVWTNTRYKMVYMNQGHIFHVFDSPVQNKMYDDAVMWLGTGAKSR
jgi:type 1 glutamine amidotransferase